MTVRWLGLVLLVLCAAQPALAQDEPTEPSQSALAIEKSKLARAHYDKGEWEEALALFLEAENLYHSPVLVLYAARCQRNMGRLLEAKALYLRLAEEVVAPSAAPSWKQAVNDGAADLAALTPDIPQVTVVVKGASAAPRLTVDGQPAEIGAPMELNPGEHVFAVTAGAQSRQEKVALVKGDRGKTITIDVSKPAPDPTPKPEDELNAPALALTIIGGAAVVVGAIFGGLALRKVSQAEGKLPLSCDEERVCPPYEQEEIDASFESAFTFADLSDGFLIGGGVVVAVGVILWVLDPFDDDDAVQTDGGTLRIRF